MMYASKYELGHFRWLSWPPHSTQQCYKEEISVFGIRIEALYLSSEIIVRHPRFR